MYVEMGGTYVKKTWMAAATQRTPNTIKSFHLMLANPGGKKRPRAKLNSQFPMAAMPYKNSQYIYEEKLGMNGYMAPFRWPASPGTRLRQHRPIQLVRV
jgi:hypothetical protein